MVPGCLERIWNVMKMKLLAELGCVLGGVTGVMFGEVVPVVARAGAEPVIGIAADDLAVALGRMYPEDEFPRREVVPKEGRFIRIGALESDPQLGKLIDADRVAVPESYLVTRVGDGAEMYGLVVGRDGRGAFYGVHALLERLGCSHTLSGDTLPPASGDGFGFDAWEMADRPLVKDRLVFNWHNFLSGCSTWNLEEWRQWTRQSQKMGYNAIMVHAYGNNPMVRFEFGGKMKPVGYLSTTVKGRDWATMHVNDVRRLWGGEVFDEDEAVFGAEAAMVPDGERAEHAEALMREVIGDAAERGMGVYFAVDMDTTSANPQELIKALPEEARFPIRTQAMKWMGQDDSRMWLADPDTEEGYGYYRTQVESLMNAYPGVSDLVVWFRRGQTPWLGMKLEEMPAAWQAEYAEEVKETPEAAGFWKSHSLFAYGKVVKAFRRALDETGHAEVALATGSWGFEFLPASDRFLPEGVKLIGLDYDVLHDNPILEDGKLHEMLRAVGARRPLIPVMWAHHDDGNYVGRSYTPFADFRAKLRQVEAGGFGIIHWTTRPLDLYFMSLAKQVWEASEDEPLGRTCGEAAVRWFGSGAGEVMGEYLKLWVSEAPKFGRETGNRFLDKPLRDVRRVEAGCRERLELIGAVDRVAMTAEQRERLDYFKGLEESIIAVHRTHDVHEQARARMKVGDVEGARVLMEKVDVGAVIGDFARFSSSGGITRGEQGLVVSMNTRWLPHVMRDRQALGVEAVRVNFAPTSHDPLAQSAGGYTFHFEEDRSVWECRGLKETGRKVFVLPEGRVPLLAAGDPAAWAEICRSGIESDGPIEIELPKVAAGEYELELLLLDPTAGAAGQNVFEVAVNRGRESDGYEFDPVSARQVRIVCKGNSQGDWNSLLEVELDGVAREGGKAVVSASAAVAGYPAAHAMDGDEGTRWAARGIGQWLQFGMVAGTELREIGLAWYQGDVREARFEVMTSDDGLTWTAVGNLRRKGGAAVESRESVDVFALAGGAGKAVARRYPVSLERARALGFSLIPTKGVARICGAVLRPKR